MTGSPLACRLAFVLLLTQSAAVTLAAPANSSASQSPAAPVAAPVLAPAARLQGDIEKFLLQQSKNLPGEVSVQVNLADSVSLPDCPEFALSRPSGARAMGRGSVIVQCPGAGGSWSLMVPVQIQVMGSYLVTARPVPAGQALTAEDLSSRSGDLGGLPASVLTQADQAVGQMPRSALGVGQPVRREMLKTTEVIRGGQSVKVISAGNGFEVSNTGTTLNGGGVGASIRVRLANGQVVSGNATPSGAVRLGP